MSTTSTSLPLDTRIAFIGGGNMASAIIGGLVRQGLPPDRIAVIEPVQAARDKLRTDHGVLATAQAGDALREATLVVWAVKPQTFRDAALPVRPLTGHALHLSVAAGIRSDSIAQWLGSERVVRSMPNTPALIGQGMTALYARAAATAPDCALIEQVLQPTGELLWVEHEEQLDAVTALSGSGPAYVFFFIEAMTAAGVQMGLSAQQAQRLAIGTFAGAAALAQRSDEPPSVLRERVTSKGGTTYAALTSMQADAVDALFAKALHAARDRAKELGDEFGR